MASNTNDFVKGAKRVPFHVGAETMQVFNIKKALEDSLNNIGAQFPLGFAKGNEPTNG